MTWFRRKNVDQLTAAAALQNTDRVIVAQGASPEAKEAPLSALGTWLLQFLGTIATQNANAINVTGGTMTGVAIHGLSNPALSGDAANKAYVDALALNVAGRGAVRVASTANVSIATGLANGQTIDGKTLVTGDLVLLKDQSTASQNGVYVASASGTASRAPQFDAWSEIPGSLVVVEEGTANGDTLWICTADQGGTLGSTSVPFTRIRIDIAIPVTPAQGGFGADNSASSGVPLFASGAVTFTSTNGSGTFVRTTSAALTTPSLGVATATSVNKVAFTAPATSATLTIPDGVTLTGPAASGTVMTLGNAETVSGVKLFNDATFALKGGTSGTTTLRATAIAGTTTLTLPAATDTLVGKATTDTLTNKTLTAPVINSPTGIVKGDVGLGSVDNTSDASKPVSTAQATAIAAKVTGPGVSNNFDVAIFVGTTGKVITDSGYVVPSSAFVGISDAQTLTTKTIDTASNTFKVNGTTVATAADFAGVMAQGGIAAKLSAANFNSTADQAISVVLPTGYTRYRIQAVIFSNPSISLTTATGGVYTATSKGGVAVVAAAQNYSALTTNTAGASGSLLSATVTNSNTAYYNSATLYLSLTTAQGSAATADITVIIQPLP